MDALKLTSLHSLRNEGCPYRLVVGAVSRGSTRLCVISCGLGAQSKEPTSSQLPTEKSRGDIFLERALSKLKLNNNDSSLTTLTPDKKKKKKKKKDSALFSKLNAEPGCYGCGATLQTDDIEAPGYVSLETYEVKKKHHQLRTVLCGRCRALVHGQMVPAVGGHGGYGGGKRFVTSEQLRMELTHIRDEKALIIKLVDIVDFNGTYLTRIRDLVGANPIVLVVTKIDLLPRATNLSAVSDWILEFLMRKKLNVISVHLTSSKSMAGISTVVSYLRQQRQGRNVFILGSANVGKSTFVNALLKELSKRDYAASAALRHLPIQSAMPGTTLGPIRIKAFSGGSLFDTPGIHVHHRMAAVVSPSDLTLLAPRRPLRGYLVAPSVFSRTASTLFSTKNLAFHASGDGIIPNNGNVSGAATELLQSPTDVAGDAGDDEVSLCGMSVFWGGFLRLDVVKVPPFVGFHIYGATAISKETVPTLEADLFYKEELGKKLTPPTNADNWPGLESIHQLDLKFVSWDRPACDIAISGLGWISIECGYSEYMEQLEAQTMSMDKAVQLTLRVPKAVEIFVRPSLPVGAQGSEWYSYRELTEKELETRPQVFLPFAGEN